MLVSISQIPMPLLWLLKKKLKLLFMPTVLHQSF